MAKANRIKVSKARPGNLPGEVIVEFSGPGGKGGLISIAPSSDGGLVLVDVYRCDPGVVVRNRQPPCLADMGCLCAGHARGAAPDEPCDTTE
jgi:hypothetical protein